MSPTQVEQTVDAIAAALGMPIPECCRPGVLQLWELMHALAQQFVAFELPADLPPAPIFRP